MSSGLKLSAPYSLCSLISLLVILQLVLTIPPAKADDSSYGFEAIGDFTINNFSQDGSTLVGHVNWKAVKWTNGKITNLSDDTSNAISISADGAVIVGYTKQNASSKSAVQWVNGTKKNLDLGNLRDSLASSVSADGTVIVGWGSTYGTTKAFRWTESEGMVDLGYLDPANQESLAYAVSADGSSVVGHSRYGGNLQAFRWQNGTMKGLGFLSTERTQRSEAFAVSKDGSVVVGASVNERGATEAFRWINGTMSGLGILDGTIQSFAYDVSADGNVVVGNSIRPGYYEYKKAFRWTPTEGMVSIEDILTNEGVDLTGMRLETATAISDDGSMIGGTLHNGHSYIANIPFAGIITPEALYQSLGIMEQVGPMVSNMGQLSMGRLTNVASGHAPRSQVRSSGKSSGMSSGDTMPGRLDLWMVGSFGTNIELNSDDSNLSGGLGLSWETDNWRFGGGLFADSRDLETGYNGSQDISALGPGAFVTYSPEGTRFEFRVSSLWQSVDLDLTRGYMNGAGYATSSGSTGAEVFSLSGQVQWTSNISETLSLTPFIEYTWQTTHVDAYTESGGPFPASFDSRDENSNLIRTGLRADVALIDKLDTWVWGAWNHRLEDTSTGMSGSATGIGAFAYPGAPIDQDWADVGIGAAWSITDRLSASTSLGFSVGCDDNSVSDTTLSAGLSYQLW
tara:strand:- start:17384 stop:19429 length:2046 start_codon:yes stop_codon:yes gene_type:complete